MYMCKNVSIYLLVQMYILLKTVTSQQTTYQFLLRLRHLGPLPLLPLYNKRAILLLLVLITTLTISVLRI